MALLHLIVREVEQGCNVACTSKPQQWHKPKSKGKIHVPDFVKNLVVHQAKGQFHTTPNEFEKSSRSSHDPRSYAYRRDRTLNDFNLERLKQITSGNCAVLLYTPLNNGISDNNANNDCNTEESNQNIKVEGISHIATKILNSNPGLSLTEFKEILDQEIQVNEQLIHTVAFQTKSQSNSSTWFALRLGRITASNVKQCIKKVSVDGSVSKKNNSLLGNILAYTPSIQTREMRHGVKMERTCINHYIAVQKKRHVNFQVTSTGLHISEKYPFIAASPDGIINCSCPTESPNCNAKRKEGCLEVKNPFTSDKIAVWATKPSSCLLVQQDGTTKLNKDHQYYAQVQCQMFVTNTDYADFVVRTSAKSSNIHIERINKDTEFIDNMITKCRIFFNKAIVPELYHGVVKEFYILRFVEEVVEKIVNHVCFLESHHTVGMIGTKKLRLR